MQSGFTELDSAEQISTSCIGKKPDQPIWEIKTSDFSRTYNFPRFDQKSEACCAKSFTTIFSSVET
jgi:hypothetical protein